MYFTQTSVDDESEGTLEIYLGLPHIFAVYFLHFIHLGKGDYINQCHFPVLMNKH